MEANYLLRCLTKILDCSIVYAVIASLILFGCSKEPVSTTSPQPKVAESNNVESKPISTTSPQPKAAESNNVGSKPVSTTSPQPYTVFVVLAPIDYSSKKLENHQVASSFLEFFDASPNFPQEYRYEFRGICHSNKNVEFLGSVDGSNSVPPDAIQWLNSKENRFCDASPRELQSFMSQIRTSVDDSSQRVIIFFQTPWSDIDGVGSSALSSEISKIKNKQNICAAFFFGANGNSPSITSAFQKLGNNIGPTKAKSQDQLENLIEKAESTIVNRCLKS